MLVLGDRSNTSIKMFHILTITCIKNNLLEIILRNSNKYTMMAIKRFEFLGKQDCINIILLYVF